MTEKGFEQLKIDAVFKKLIQPLSHEEYDQMEANLVRDGCRDPILTWKHTIIDGHNRYEICNRFHIPYAVQDITFKGLEYAILWICENQLNRMNLTEEMRKYLIGRQYDVEKTVEMARKERRESSRRMASRLGDKYHISSGAVQKYAGYSRAIDVLGEKIPELIPRVLSSNYKISHDNIMALSKMDTEEVKALSAEIGIGSVSHIRYCESRRSFLCWQNQKPIVVSTDAPPIKTMPEYDPDSLAKGLAATIIEWARSIELARENDNPKNVSCKTKTQLKNALVHLQGEILTSLDTMKEDT